MSSSFSFRITSLVWFLYLQLKQKPPAETFVLSLFHLPNGSLGSYFFLSLLSLSFFFVIYIGVLLQQEIPFF